MRSSYSGHGFKTCPTDIDDDLLPTMNTVLYQRSSSELIKPSKKLDFDNWTYDYAPQMQRLWNANFPAILQEEMNSNSSAGESSVDRSSVLRPRNSKSLKQGIKLFDELRRSKKSKRQSVKNANKNKKKHRSRAISEPSKVICSGLTTKHVPYLLGMMCKSLRFGIMNIQCKKEETVSMVKESDILTFYFTISWQDGNAVTNMLRLRLLFDDAVSRSGAGDMSIQDLFQTETRTRKLQIACDWDYAQINRIINHKSQAPINTPLTAEILGSVFEYVKPNKFLALYSCRAHGDDLDIIDTDKMAKKHFKRSNIQWVSSFFGVPSSHLSHLLRVLIDFLDHEEVFNLIENIKEEKFFSQQYLE